MSTTGAAGKAAADVTGNRAWTRDGTAIAYEIHRGGNGARRIALVHSLAMDRSFWRPVAERLSAQADVLIYDCRGHGQSDKPAGPYSVQLFADDLADLLDAVGWGSALVAGASMGGCVALAFAAGYPQRTDALGLIDTTAWYGPEAPKQWAERAQKAVDNGMAALIDFQKSRWFGDAFRDRNQGVVDQAVGVFLKNDVGAYAETCRMLGACDLRSAMPGFTMPTRIVVGEEDYATPVAMAEAMRQSIPGAGLTVVPGARHFTPLEVPDAIAEQLARLLEESDARA